MNSWIEDWCPKCHSRNWVNNGDVSDCTVSDIEALRCYKCGFCWFLGETFDDDDDRNPQDYADDGLASPDFA